MTALLLTRRVAPPPAEAARALDALVRETVATGTARQALLLRLSTAQALEVTRALDFAREVRVVTRPAGEP
jgi:hypothetical protein